MKTNVTDLGKVCITPKGIWDSNNTYERLDLVYCKQTKSSYVARINVPADVNIDNEKYWQLINASDFIQIVEYIDYKFGKIIEYIDTKSNDEIEEQIIAIQSEINGMNDTINTFTTDINNQMQEFYDNQDDKFNTFKNDIDDIIDTHINNALPPVVEELHQYSDTNKQDAKNYTDSRITELTNNIDDKVNDSINNNDTIDSINQTVGQHTTKIATLENSVNSLNTRVTSAETNVTNLTSDVNTMRADVATAKSDATTAKSDASIAKTDAANAKSEINTVKADVNTLKTDMTTAKSDINTNKSAISGINSSISSINSDISNINNEIDELKSSAGGGTTIVTADNISVINLSAVTDAEDSKINVLNNLTTTNHDKLVEAINNDYVIMLNIDYVASGDINCNQKVTAIRANIKNSYIDVRFIFNSYLTDVRFNGNTVYSIYSERILDNTDAINNTNTRIDEIDTTVNSVDTSISNINSQISNLDSRIDTLQTQVDNIPAAGEVASTLEVLPIEVNLNPSNGNIRDIKTIFDISHFQRLLSAINANKSILLNVNVYEYDDIISNDKILVTDASANESESTIYLEFLYNSVYYYLHITPLNDVTYILRYKEIDNTSISRRLDTIDEQLTNIPDTTRYNYVMIDK